MKPQDRIKVLIVGGLLLFFVLGAGAFVLNSQFLAPRVTRISVLQDELNKAELGEKEVEDAVPRLKEMQKLSLPPDQATSQQKYAAELETMLKDSGFSADKRSVLPKQLENRSNIPPSKRPPYTKLIFTVVAHGDLMSIVDFLDRFYRLPLLHRISNFRITRPLTVAQGQRQTELDFSITVEALIVEGAEKRDTLLPKGMAMSKRLARSSLSQYQSIAGRNIFFGPAARTDSSAYEIRDPDFDEKDFIKLTEITHCDLGTWATLYDQANRYDYLIAQQKDGTFKVDVSCYVKDRKLNLRSGKDLDVQDEHGESLAKYQVVRIDTVNLILRQNDQYFCLNPGDSIKDLKKPLTSQEVKDLGLTELPKKPEPEPKAEKKDAKPIDKPAKDAKPGSDSKPPEKIEVKKEIPANGENK
jgi:hypothetical protein